MNENLNLVEILKDCPQGTKLYSSIYGEVELVNVLQGEDVEYPIEIKLNNNIVETFTNGGRLLVDYDGECTLFPSKDQRDWSKFIVPDKIELKFNVGDWIITPKDKLIQELGEYKVKYTQEVLEKYINSMSNKDDERLRKTAIDFLKDFAEQGYENAVECIDWLEKQGEYLENYDEAEKEKADFVGDGFIECHADFLDFKEGNTYWLEYIGDDKYNVRSDNLLCKTYHITPCQLYTVFKKLTWIEKQGKQETLYDKCRKIIRHILSRYNRNGKMCC